MAFILVLCLIIVSLGCILLVGFSGRDRAVLLSLYNYLSHDGLKRAYLLWEPGNKPVKRLVVSFHGFADNARRHAYYTALHNCVDGHTVVIYPQAVKPTKKGILNGWNAGFCCGSGWVQKADDVGFSMSLIDKYRTKYGLKPENVYLSGFSNGAMLVQKIATEHPKMINGVASVSGTVGANDCQLKPHQPAPILMVHGKKDKNIPFNGGLGLSPGFMWRSFDQSLKTWQAANQSLKKPIDVNRYPNKVVTNYRGKKPLTTILYDNGGHCWNGWRLWQLNRKYPEASQAVIEFFRSV